MTERIIPIADSRYQPQLPHVPAHRPAPVHQQKEDPLLHRLQALRLRQTLVLAPDSGVISARSATVGAVLPAGAELFRLIRQGRLEWRGEVTSTEIGRITPGTSVVVTAPGGAQLNIEVTMEVEGGDKPVCVADSLSRRYTQAA